MSEMHLIRCRTAALISCAVGISMLTTAAHAFTFDDKASDSNDNTIKFADPADRTKSRMTNDGSDKTRIRSGPTFQFGARQSIDQRYSGDRYFSPNNLMGR